MNVKLTNETLAALALPAGKTDHIEFDGDLPGFGVRLRRGRDGSVKRSWLVQYRLGVQQRRESLGDVRKVKLEDARKIARQRFAQVELGTDPAAERAKARADAAASKLTLGVVADLYLAAKKDRQRPSTHGQCKLHLTGHWKALRDHPIDTIKRADVAAALQGITKAHGRTAASRARSNLSALFMWAMGEGVREDNPVIATNNPAEGILSRERVLSDAELQIVWNACRDDDFGRIVKLLILTGCRREEIGGLKRNEVNLDTGIMTVPGTRTKNYREHALTLPAVAIDILKSVPARPDREFFFGVRGGSFCAWSYATLHLHARIAEAKGQPLPRWTLHDLRRTVRTGMGRLGVAPHIAELVLNHRKGGVEAIYDRHKYEREITAALALWADHVLAAVEGRSTQVVPLLRALK